MKINSICIILLVALIHNADAFQRLKRLKKRGEQSALYKQTPLNNARNEFSKRTTQTATTTHHDTPSEGSKEFDQATVKSHKAVATGQLQTNSVPGKTTYNKLPEKASAAKVEDFEVIENDENTDSKLSESTPFTAPSIDSKIVEPIGYDATGMNYQQSATERTNEREMNERPVANSETFNDENEFVKDATSSLASNDGDESSSSEEEENIDETGKEEHQQASQHDHILENTSPVGNDKIAEEAVTESFDEKPGLNSPLP